MLICLIQVRFCDHFSLYVQGLCRPHLKQKILKSSKKDNGLAFHAHQAGHKFDFDHTEIIAREPNYWRRLILEGIEIKFASNLANLQLGYEIDEIWTPILQSTIAAPQH